jgi:cytochrome c551/c552/cytochrome c553
MNRRTGFGRAAPGGGPRQGARGAAPPDPWPLRLTGAAHRDLVARSTGRNGCRSSVVWRAGVLAALLAFGLAAVAGAQSRFPGIGRPATPAEVRAWDTDVRPDFTGLPRGSGSVAKGQEIWEKRCASCHGIFGESTLVFPPIVGGTTAKDIERGRVAALRDPAEQRTTLMKLPTLSTLWDYVNRAMPWDRPRSLTVDEVYAVVAFVLHLGDIVPADFVLSDRNIRDVQARLPNRNGMTLAHGLWDVRGAPDVQGNACMTGCPAGSITSEIPAHARNAHGNLVAQHRVIGPVRGADTTRPPLTAPAGAETAELTARALAAVAPPAEAPGGMGLARQHACLSCHALDQRLVGPSFKEIATRYRAGGDTALLIGKMKTGGAGVWGPVPMPPQAHVGDADLQALARWILVELR